MTMVNKSKAKGTRAETAVVKWLNDHNFAAKRKELKGAKDEGDVEIANIPVIIQVKWTAATPTSGQVDQWLAATTEQAKNASINKAKSKIRYHPILVHNRQRCTDVGKWIWYVWSWRERHYMRMDGHELLWYLEVEDW